MSVEVEEKRKNPPAISRPFSFSFSLSLSILAFFQALSLRANKKNSQQHHGQELGVAHRRALFGGGGILLFLALASACSAINDVVVPPPERLDGRAPCGPEVDGSLPQDLDGPGELLAREPSRARPEGLLAAARGGREQGREQGRSLATANLHSTVTAHRRWPRCRHEGRKPSRRMLLLLLPPSRPRDSGSDHQARARRRCAERNGGRHFCEQKEKELFLPFALPSLSPKFFFSKCAVLLCPFFSSTLSPLCATALPPCLSSSSLARAPANAQRAAAKTESRSPTMTLLQ